MRRLFYIQSGRFLDELPEFKGLFAVSSTRLSIQKDYIHLQRIRRVNGIDIGDDGDDYGVDLSCYRQLTEALSCWMKEYEVFFGSYNGVQGYNTPWGLKGY